MHCCCDASHRQKACGEAPLCGFPGFGAGEGNDLFWGGGALYICFPSDGVVHNATKSRGSNCPPRGTRHKWVLCNHASQDLRQKPSPHSSIHQNFKWLSHLSGDLCCATCGRLTTNQRQLTHNQAHIGAEEGEGGGWHEAMVLGCLLLAAPIGLSPKRGGGSRGAGGEPPPCQQDFQTYSAPNALEIFLHNKSPYFVDPAPLPTKVTLQS